MEELKKLNIYEKNCLLLILEFLDSYTLNQTSQILRQEASEVNMSLPEVPVTKAPRIKKDNIPVILSLMKSLDHTAFFEGWESLIPKEIQSLPEYKKLTIYFYIFFATLPQRKIRNKSLDNNIDVTYDTDQILLNSANSNTGLNKCRNYPLSVDENGCCDRKDSHKEEIYKKNRADIEHLNNLTGIAIQNILSNADIKGVNLITYEKNVMEGPNSRVASEYSGMEMFKNFLLTKGSEYAGELEFLPFFALPFVESPKDHPIFSGIFKESWLKDLESMLIQFLIEYSCGDSVVPELMKICASRNEPAQTEMVAKSILDEYIKRYKEIKCKFYKLRKDHQNIVGVASELATALENSVRGDAVDLKAILENCVNIFPDLFLKSSPKNLNDCYVNRALLTNKRNNFSEFDVNKMKRDISTGNEKLKVQLLQAIRWFLTHKRSDERELTVAWIVRHDILGLKSGYLKEDLKPNSVPHPVQQAIARLINGLASLKSGREYLASSQDLIKMLVDAAKLTYKVDQITCDMLIASLQKLSLRTGACNVMLSNQMIEWLLEQLNSDHFYGYFLVYSASLLMNLILHTEQDFWLSNIKLIVAVIFKLIKTCENEVLEFIFGILYFLLRDDTINNEFRTCDLLSLLKEKLGNYMRKDIIAERQLATLISLHQREISPEVVTTTPEDSVEDDMEDPDELEHEIDAGDVVIGMETGEHYLNQHYRLIFLPKGVVKRISPTNDEERKINISPTTPQSSYL